MPELVRKTIQRKIITNLNVKDGYFYIHIGGNLRISDDATVQYVKSTEWRSNFPDLSPLPYHVWKELTQLLYRSQRERFQSMELLQQKLKKHVTSLTTR